MPHALVVAFWILVGLVVVIGGAAAFCSLALSIRTDRWEAYQRELDSAAKAARMESSTFARIMQPPFQMRAIS